MRQKWSQRIADWLHTVRANAGADGRITGQFAAACAVKWWGLAASCKMTNYGSTRSAVPGIRIAAGIRMCRFQRSRICRLRNWVFSSSWTSGLISWNRFRGCRSGDWNRRRHTWLIGDLTVPTVAAAFSRPTTGLLLSHAVLSVMSVTTRATRNSRQRFVGARAVDYPLTGIPRVLWRRAGGSRNCTMWWWWCWPTRLWSSQSTGLGHRPDSAGLVTVRRTTSGENMCHIAR